MAAFGYFSQADVVKSVVKNNSQGCLRFTQVTMEPK